MPSGPRIKANNIFGVTSDNPLTIGATTFNSASLFLLPAVSSAHAVIVLDPKRVNGEPEIVIVTAHTALATSATITRAAYGTTARAHPVNTQWAHVAVTDDLIPIVTSGTRPSDPFEGQMIYETDTHRPVHRDNTQWLPGGPVSVVTSGTRPANPYTGQTIHETDTGLYKYWNGSNWVTTINMKFFGANAALAGSPPAIDTGSVQFKLQAGTTVDTTSASGLMTLTFPNAFPNGLITCVVCQGGNTVQDLIFATTGGSASSITIVAIHGNNTPSNTQLVRYNWFAIGW